MSADWRLLLQTILTVDKDFNDHVAECGLAEGCAECDVHGERFETALVGARKAFKDEELDAASRKSRDRALF